MQLMTATYATWNLNLLKNEVQFLGRAQQTPMIKAEIAHMEAEIARREGKSLFYTYTAKNFSQATDFRTVAKTLAAAGYKAVIKGMTLTIDAPPVLVSYVAKDQLS